MIEILAQGLKGEAMTAVGGITVGGLSVYIIQQIIKRGIHAKIDVGGTQQENSNGKTIIRNRNGPVVESMCRLRHEELEKRQNERYEAEKLVFSRLEKGQDEIKESIVTLHERIDAVLQSRARK